MSLNLKWKDPLSGETFFQVYTHANTRDGILCPLWDEVKVETESFRSYVLEEPGQLVTWFDQDRLVENGGDVYGTCIPTGQWLKEEQITHSSEWEKVKKVRPSS